MDVNSNSPPNKTSLEDLKTRCSLVALGLAVGDSLGATSEFQIPWEVGKNCIEQYPGWPERIVGGGVANWTPGKPTDDSEMGIAIVRAVRQNGGKLLPEKVLEHFERWVRTGPKDIGTTTRTALNIAKRNGSKWWSGGLEVHKRNEKNAANGSLMRNGVIPALYPLPEQEIEALDATIVHGIITHYSPICVLTCVVQTLLVRHALQAKDLSNLKAPTIDDVKELLDGPWTEYQQKTQNPDAKMWLDKIGSGLIKVEEKRLIIELKGFEDFDPYHQDYRGTAGYCVLCLRLGLWALHWSFRKDHPKIPEWLPEWIFERHGFDTLMWVVVIGADADTNGASAGPLLAAYHGSIGDNFLQKLLLREEIVKHFTTGEDISSDLNMRTTKL